MKIIGTTYNGCLAEVSADELTILIGYSVRHIEIGTVFNILPAIAYLRKLHDQEKKCRDSAAFLRGMADMLDAALPTTIIPPEAQP